MLASSPGRTNSDSSIAIGQSYQEDFGGFEDAFIAKFNSGGTLKWSTYYGGSSYDRAFDIETDDSSTVYFSGVTLSPTSIASSNGHQNTMSSISAFLVKLKECSLDSVEITASVCRPYISPSGKYSWNISGVYYDTLTKYDGCDSVLKILLTIKDDSSFISDSACREYNSPSGKYTWIISGTYMDTLVNKNGCDSVISFDINILPNKNVIQSGKTLSALASPATYQWIDCSTGIPISGATNINFTPSSDGEYAVIINQNGCIDTSDCYEVVSIGIKQKNTKELISIYPNPTTGKITIQTNENAQGEIRIINLLGELVFKTSITGGGITQVTLPSSIENGVYFVEVKTHDGKHSERIVLQREL